MFVYYEFDPLKNENNFHPNFNYILIDSSTDILFKDQNDLSFLTRSYSLLIWYISYCFICIVSSWTWWNYFAFALPSSFIAKHCLTVLFEFAQCLWFNWGIILRPRPPFVILYLIQFHTETFGCPTHFASYILTPRTYMFVCLVIRLHSSL